MKRAFLIFALCGSVLAGEPDFTEEQRLSDELKLLAARIEETGEQIKYHRRRALYCEGVLIELEHLAKWNDPDVSDTRFQIRYHNAKAAFFADLSRELYYEQTMLQYDLEKRRFK